MGRQRRDGDPFGLTGTRLAYRHGAFYYRHRDGRWERIGTDLAAAKRRAALYNDPGGVYGTTGYWLDRFVVDCEARVKAHDLAERTLSDYRKDTELLKAVFGGAEWSEATLLVLKKYLTSRSNKKDKTKKAGTTANREIAAFQIVWNWARQTAPEGRDEPYTVLPWPAAGMERSRWKNAEQAREFEVTDDLFAAVYAEACQFLRDTMDLSSATGMRLTDCIKVTLPRDGVLRLKASKTGKKADFDLTLSEVLPAMVERRRGYEANHLMLISRPDGFPVHLKDLRREWDKARAKAATKARADRTPEAQEFAVQIEAMWLRDMRKMAADQAVDAEAASKLLQHSSVALTKRHYRTRGDTLKPVR
jgi:hypothetical protein